MMRRLPPPIRYPPLHSFAFILLLLLRLAASGNAWDCNDCAYKTLTRDRYLQNPSADFNDIKCIAPQSFQNADIDVTLGSMLSLRCIGQLAFAGMKGVLTMGGDYPNLVHISSGPMAPFDGVSNSDSVVEMRGLKNLKTAVGAFHNFKGSKILLEGDLSAISNGCAELVSAENLFKFGGLDMSIMTLNFVCDDCTKMRSTVETKDIQHATCEGPADCACRSNEKKLTAEKFRVARNKQTAMAEAECIPTNAFVASTTSGLTLKGLWPNLRCIERLAFALLPNNSPTLHFHGVFDKLEVISSLAFSGGGSSRGYPYSSDIDLTGLNKLESIGSEAFLNFPGKIQYKLQKLKIC